MGIGTTSELVFPMENYGFSKAQIKEKLTLLVKTFGLEKLMSKNIFLLSSGERQMVALASALTMNQQVVLFDEPSVNLDFGNAMKLGQIISWLKNQGITVIVADHRFYYLSNLIDHVFFMEKGNLHIYDSAALSKREVMIHAILTFFLLKFLLLKNFLLQKNLYVQTLNMQSTKKF